MLRYLINFTPNAWDFLPQQRRLFQKSPFTLPKFLSIPARRNGAPLPLLFKGRFFVSPALSFRAKRFRSTQFFCGRKKLIAQKVSVLQKFFLAKFLLRSKTGLSLKSLAGVSQSAASSEMRVKSRSSRAAAPAPVTTANCGSSQTWVRISRFLAIYSGTKEIFATPPDRYTPF